MSSHVLIVGSGPNARIAKADQIYFANYSHTAFSQAEIRRTGARIIGFWSAPAIFSEYFPNKNYIPAAMRDSLKSSWFSSRVVACTSIKHVPQGALDTIPVQLLFPSDLSTIMTTVVGRAGAFISWPHFVAGAVAEPRKFKRLGRQLLRYWRTHESELNSYFRPSTGILALCYAIKNCGPDKTYILSGFEFRERRSHVQGPSFSETRGWYRNHVIADQKVLKALSRRFSIVVQ